jgi:endonuclease III
LQETDREYWDKVLAVIEDTVTGTLPSVSEIGRETSDPFRVLISTVISLRTRDEVTFSASMRLFERADTPRDMLALPEEEISRLIYPAGFYRTKAQNIKRICGILQNDFGGAVPGDREHLLSLPGVGLKTANLVLSLGLNIPAICVDTHVHRIANRMGWVKTAKPDDTEKALSHILPEKYWIPINELLVLYGQQICHPLSPRCSVCPATIYCLRNGVERHR